MPEPTSTIQKFTSEELKQGIRLATGKNVDITLGIPGSHFISSEDTHYNYNSSVLLPDLPEDGLDNADQNKLTGIVAIASALKFLGENPEKKILVAGHTDPVGSDAFNIDLSELRAQGVLHILESNREEWVSLVDSRNSTEDIQTILTYMAQNWGWECHPGEIDGENGSLTKAAIEKFQTNYNQKLDPLNAVNIGQIQVDGEFGPETWGAVFDVYKAEIILLLDTTEERLIDIQAQLDFLEPKQKFVGCGEHQLQLVTGSDQKTNLAENEDPNRKNRRVEILFFDPEKLPQLVCHPGNHKCIPEKCQIYPAERIPITPVVPIVGKGRLQIELGDNLLFPDETLFILEGDPEPTSLLLKDVFDDSLGTYRFSIGPFKEGITYSAFLKTSEEKVSLFENEDLKKQAESTEELEPLEFQIGDVGSNIILEPLEVDEEIPDEADGEWPFYDNQIEGEQFLLEENAVEGIFDGFLETDQDN